MIILDTNVLSEFMQSQPSPIVVAWLNEQPLKSVWTTSVCIFEVRYGLAMLPNGKRRQMLSEAFDATLQNEIEDRVVDFDRLAASEAARIAAKLRSSGRPPDHRDVMIAGIVAAAQGKLATRNIKHFADTGIPMVNPWDHKP